MSRSKRIKNWLHFTTATAQTDRCLRAIEARAPVSSAPEDLLRQADRLHQSRAVADGRAGSLSLQSSIDP